MEHASQRLDVDSVGWRQSKDDVQHLSVIQEAVWLDRRLVLGYRGADRKMVERVVGPLDRVVDGYIWYFDRIGHGDPPACRLSRVDDAVITNERFTRPSNFDLVIWWTESSAGFHSHLPAYLVSVRVASKTDAVTLSSSTLQHYLTHGS